MLVLPRNYGPWQTMNHEGESRVHSNTHEYVRTRRIWIHFEKYAICTWFDAETLTDISRQNKASVIRLYVSLDAELKHYSYGIALCCTQFGNQHLFLIFFWIFLVNLFTAFAFFVSTIDCVVVKLIIFIFSKRN